MSKKKHHKMNPGKIALVRTVSWFRRLGRPKQQQQSQKPEGMYKRAQERIDAQKQEKSKIVTSKKFSPDLAFFLLIFGLSMCFIFYAIYFFSQLK